MLFGVVVIAAPVIKETLKMILLLANEFQVDLI